MNDHDPFETNGSSPPRSAGFRDIPKFRIFSPAGTVLLRLVGRLVFAFLLGVALGLIGRVIGAPRWMTDGVAVTAGVLAFGGVR